MKTDERRLDVEVPVDHALAALNERAHKYYADSKAKNTKDAYHSDFKHFASFCAQNGFGYLPAGSDTVALYLASLADAGFKASTITRRISAISQFHQHSGFESPTRHASVRAVMAGIRRNIGSIEVGRSPVMDTDLRMMLTCLRPGLIGIRDRALLLLGFTSAMRRSEIVALNVNDVTETPEGLTILIRSSKTDVELRGEMIATPRANHPETCTVAALNAWYRASGIDSGSIFRAIDRHGNLSQNRLSSKAVALVVKEMVQRIGLDASRFAAHSLRSGFCTSTAKAGVPERIIQLTSRHRNLVTLRRYIKTGNLFNESAVKALGF